METYYWLSRTLRETVQLYGKGARGYHPEILEGEYYTGISFEAVLPSFQVSLHGWTLSDGDRNNNMY